MPEAATPATLPLDALLRQHAARDPQRLAIAISGASLGDAPLCMTVGELVRLAGSAAAKLESQGIGPGDRVAVWGQNSAAWAVWLVAAAWRGASVVALHPGLSTPDLMASLAQSRPAWLVLDEVARGVSLVDAARTATGHACDGRPGATGIQGLCGVTAMRGGDGHPDLRALLDPDATPPASLSHADAPLCMQFTSGSSGRPKLVSLSHRALILNAQRTAAAAGITAGDRIASPLPLYHAAGVSSGLVLSLVTQALWCSGHRFQADAVLAQIEAHGCTVLQGVPTMFKSLITAAASRARPTTLRLGFIGGAPSAPSLCRQAIDALGLQAMCVVYGQTEFGPTISMTDPAAPIGNDASVVGAPIEGTQVRIADPATLADCDEGEILVRGATSMDGYFDDGPATHAAVTAERWLRTGDLGRWRNGSLQVIGRLKTLIIRGGENVSPTEVEEALREASQVLDVCVVAVPSAHWGEAICAVVVDSAEQPVHASSLRVHCERRLSRHKRPDHYLSVRELPLLASGKVDRRAVQALALALADKELTP